MIHGEIRAFLLHGEVVLTQADVRALQFAKGAISTGIETAMRELGLVAGDLDEVMLAGSFGSYINPRSAQVIGLVPAVTVDKIKAVGNTASEGAKMALMSFREREVAWESEDRRVHRALRGRRLQRPIHRQPRAPPLDSLPTEDVVEDDESWRRKRRDDPHGARTAFIACGAVALDTAAIIEARGWDPTCTGSASDLHMTPQDIGPAVEEKIEKLMPDYDRVIVVYGDCGTGGRLDAVLARCPAVRPAGVHCFEWYSGDLYERYHETTGTYFLTDWLVTNWDRAVIKGLAWTVPVDEGRVLRQPHARGVRPPASRPCARGEGTGDRGLHGQSAHDEDLGIEPLERLLVPLMEEDADAVRP